MSSLDTPLPARRGCGRGRLVLKVGLPGISPPLEGRRSDRVLAPVRDALERDLAGEPAVWDLPVSYGEVARMVGRPRCSTRRRGGQSA